MRFVLAIIIGMLVLAAGCAQKAAEPKQPAAPADSGNVQVPEPTPAEQQEAVETTTEEIIPEDDTVEIGSMI
jgi:hypothetical protein